MTVNDTMELNHSYGMCFKQKTNTSQRTIHAMKHVNQVMEEIQMNQRKTLAKKKKFCFRKNKNTFVEQKIYPFKKLKCITPSSENIISTSELKKTQYVFVYDPLQKLPNDYFKGICKKIEVQNISSFKVVDEVDGCYGLSNNDIAPFILIPRNQVLNCGSNDVTHQETCLTKLVHGIVSTKRGATKKAIYSHYATFGVHAKRSSPGLSFKSIEEQLKDDYNAIIRMIQKAEHCASSVLPNSMIQAIKRTKELYEWPTFSLTSDGVTKKESILWSSIATSYDYTSTTHVDKDFFLSMLTVTTSEHLFQEKYSLRQPIALYFILPELGLAIGLRPGDHLIFNPLYYHCISTKDFSVYENPVHVTSFYLKTAVVGGNDNSNELQSKHVMT